MFERFDAELKARLTVDNHDRVRAVFHSDEYRLSGEANPRSAAVDYVRTVGPVFKIPVEQLEPLHEQASYLEPAERGIEFRFSEERRLPGSATTAFVQTYLNVPVWGSGLTVIMKPDPLRVVSAVSTARDDIKATMPSATAVERYRNLFRTAAAERVDADFDPDDQKPSKTAPFIAGLVGGPRPRRSRAKAAPAAPQEVRLIRGRFFVYRYDPAQRVLPGKAADPQPTPGLQDASDAASAGFQHDEIPVLPLPPVDARIKEGQDYVVAEITFSYPTPEFGDLNWLALVELETNSVLYLRALAASVDGSVYLADPITEAGAGNGPDQANTVLNGFRDTVALPNLNGPVGGTQSLAGARATLSDIELKTVAPPTKASGVAFNYDARTDNFAAVNAYYHSDRFFALVEDLGFPLATYFNNTTFPMPVDHRGKGTVANQGNVVNAHCVGNGMGGIGHCCYALAHTGDTGNPIGIAADWRVHLHELAGHGILYEWVNSANFGFAHSAGDSFAAILSDPDSQAPDRFVTFPWVDIGRRHDRTAAGGWGWAGNIGLNPFDSVRDYAGYNNEQILSSTMFRIYRSIGGDSSSAGRRRFAARMTAHLMLEAIATLTQATNPSNALGFANALIAADGLNWPAAGIFGGAYGKVVRWSFEQQGLYQAPGTPTPADNPGQPPSVDVYIDDGRAGEYQYLATHWNTTTIWNRHAPGGTTHQEPVLGTPNYVYVKVKNRGTQTANDVVVRGYHCRPSAGLLWPDDLQPMTTASIAVGTVAANNTEEKVVGPFEWTPVLNAYGHDCLLMVVSATNDASNVDNFTAGEVIPEWRLVPNDNNIAQRNVFPVPGGGGLAGLVAGLHGYSFWVGNPNPPGDALITLEARLPKFLAERGWELSFRGVPSGRFRLGYRRHQEVVLDLKAGRDFEASDVEAADDRDVMVTVQADGGLIGGMTYRLDPRIVRPLNPREPARDDCRDAARKLLDCLDVPGEDVDRVRVRKVVIDIEMKGDCC